MRSLVSWFGGIALLIAMSTPAQATDGVLEINQTCAAAGCFAGDTAGFPVTINQISAPHSYRLTSDLVVADENATAIIVTIPEVSIDLGGFVVTRAACVGATSPCVPAGGGGSGVMASAAVGVRIRDGSVIGMGAYGIYAGDRALVERVSVRWNRLSGLATGSHGVLRTVQAAENGAYGINASTHTNLAGCESQNNVSGGVLVSSTSIVKECVASNNGGAGISTGSVSTVVGNVAHANGGDGITSGIASVVADNVSYGNAGDGIDTANGSNVDRNALRFNVGFGLAIGLNASFRDNTISSNTAGTISGTGVSAGGNLCNGSLTCP